jgi:hypothetical protein
MERIRYEFILEAESAIAHHSETFGNSAVLMDRRVRQRDGSFVRVPVVTADTMRHGMREAAAYALLDAAGLLSAGALGEAALRLLFAGGMVTGRGDAGAISLDQYRRMSDLIPSIALFGGCADNRVIPGRLFVDDAQLACVETSHHLPSWVAEWLAAQPSTLDVARAHVEEVQRVRMDPTLDPGKRKLLSAGAEVEVSRRLLSSEVAHEEGDALAREASKSTMLPRRFEVLVQGSLLYWRVTATCYSELDRDTFHVALASFLSGAQVGGKRATGHGRLRVVQGRDVAVRRPADRSEVLDLGARMGSVFYDHVKARAKEIAEYLGTCNA